MTCFWNLVEKFCSCGADPYESGGQNQRSRPTIDSRQLLPLVSQKKNVAELNSKNNSSTNNYAYTFQYNDFAPNIHYNSTYYDQKKYVHDSLNINKSNKITSPNSTAKSLDPKSDPFKNQEVIKNSKQLKFLSGKKLENRAYSLYENHNSDYDQVFPPLPKPVVFGNRIDAIENQRVQINKAKSLLPQSIKVAEEAKNFNDDSDKESDGSTEYKKEKFKSLETYFMFFKDKYGFRFRDINNPKELFDQLATKMKWRKKPEHFDTLRQIKLMQTGKQETYLRSLFKKKGYSYNENLDLDENYEKYSENMGWNPYKKRRRDFDKIVAQVAESKFSSVRYMQGLIEEYKLLEVTSKMPQTREECKEFLEKNLFVNIYDFVAGKKKNFKTLTELRKYTIEKNLFFPLEEAKENYTSKILLRHIIK